MKAKCWMHLYSKSSGCFHCIQKIKEAKDQSTCVILSLRYLLPVWAADPDWGNVPATIYGRTAIGPLWRELPVPSRACVPKTSGKQWGTKRRWNGAVFSLLCALFSLLHNKLSVSHFSLVYENHSSFFIYYTFAHKNLYRES
jgi:hypothetical protein